jgi:hypothetical protein
VFLAMTYPSRRYNADGHGHADAFVRPRGDETPLRYADYSETGHVLRRDKLLYNDREKEVKGARDGRLRLDHHEVLSTPHGDLCFHRGGFGYLDGGNVKYGHVAVADLRDDPPPPKPAGERRGDPAPKAEDPQYVGGYFIRVKSIRTDQLYKRPSDPPPGKTKRGAKWMHYGDPGADQGDIHDVHYNYLCWSWLNARGGGMARSLVRDGQVFHRCDVASISMKSWDKEGNENGDVVGIYGKTLQAGNWLFGWVMHSHRYTPPGGEPEPWVFHLERRS